VQGASCAFLCPVLANSHGSVKVLGAAFAKAEGVVASEVRKKNRMGVFVAQVVG